MLPRLSCLLLLASSLLLTACSAPVQHKFEMAPPDALPADVQAAPVSVREAYQFAAANPDVLQHLPCYCGCGDIGHTSNYACYVSGANADGGLAFDGHALGCGICVDITQDAMRLLDDGQDVAAIRAYVDRAYAKYGPSNMTPTP